jgi:hypothetical protein
LTAGKTEPMDETVRRHNCELHGAQPARAALGALKRKCGDALDLRRGVRLGIKRALGALFDHVAAFAKIHSAGEFPHYFDVQIAEPLRPQRGNSPQRLEQPHRAQIHIKAKSLSQRQQSCFRPLANGQGIPFWSAHRPQKHGIRFAAGLQRLIWQRTSGLVDGRATNRHFGQVKLMAKLARALLQHTHCRPSYLGPDSIARQDYDSLFQLHRWVPRSSSP